MNPSRIFFAMLLRSCAWNRLPLLDIPRSYPGDPVMPQVGRKATFEAGNVRFAVKHELWDGNIDDHCDQGVAILVLGQPAGKDTTLLRFNCFDLERSYVYGPESVKRLCRM